MSYHSQIGQDKWVHSVIGDKTNGYFVELGACDGLYLSNSLYFEQTHGWQGICIEPNDNYLENLRKNRSCHVSNELIYSHEGVTVPFSLCRGNSSILDENKNPFTTTNNIVEKQTTTLSKIFDTYSAPSIIDYLSLDVEGQEYNILSTFPFDRYKFRCMTIEHNAPHVGPEMQTKIRNLLEANGYKYVKGNDDIHNWNHGPIDDFYIHPELV
jgi:FkbM family methyltransferase